MNVLWISQKNARDETFEKQCGVGIRGKLTSDILKKSKKYNFIQCFIDNNKDLENLILEYSPKVIFYNYHQDTTSWINNSEIRDRYNCIAHIMIHYDLHQNKVNYFNSNDYYGFKYLLTDDDLVISTHNVFVVPRSIPLDNFTSKYLHSIPKIGFQGFGFPHKNIPLIARMVNNEFDEAILRLHIPYAFYTKDSEGTVKTILEEVNKEITKPGIILEVSHNFMSDEKIVQWLSENTINCYFYDYLDGHGVASSPDYAISARRPIAVTKSFQLRNFWNLSPSIIIGETTLKQIIENGTKPLEPHYEKYSHKNLINAYEKICNRFY